MFSSSNRAIRFRWGISLKTRVPEETELCSLIWVSISKRRASAVQSLRCTIVKPAMSLQVHVYMPTSPTPTQRAPPPSICLLSVEGTTRFRPESSCPSSPTSLTLQQAKLAQLMYSNLPVSPRSAVVSLMTACWIWDFSWWTVLLKLGTWNTTHARTVMGPHVINSGC